VIWQVGKRGDRFYNATRTFHLTLLVLLESEALQLKGRRVLL